LEAGTVKKIFGTENPEISIIIPSLRSETELSPLLEDIQNQSLKSVELFIVYRVSPSGRARNLGAEKAMGKYLFFFDDDIRLGDENVLGNLVEVLKNNESVGLVGASIQLPPDSTSFQKRIGRQIPRMVFPIVDKITDSDMVTTQCWAQRRENFQKIGPFNEDLYRGVDPEYRQRVRSAGYRTVIAPSTWTYHPASKNMTDFIRQNYRNGYSSAYAQKNFPDLVAPVPDSGRIGEIKHRSAASRFSNIIITIIRSIVKLQFLNIIERISYGAGYFAGRLKKFD